MYNAVSIWMGIMIVVREMTINVCFNSSELVCLHNWILAVLKQSGCFQHNSPFVAQRWSLLVSRIFAALFYTAGEWNCPDYLSFILYFISKRSISVWHFHEEGYGQRWAAKERIWPYVEVFTAAIFTSRHHGLNRLATLRPRPYPHLCDFRNSAYGNYGNSFKPQF